MSDEQIEEHLRKYNITERRNVMPLIIALAALAAGLFLLILSPPQIAPWWDCRIGVQTQNMDARLRLLNSCLENGALSDTEKAVVHYKRGNAYSVTGQPEEALKDFNEAIRFRRNFADAYYNRARIYRAKEQYSRAIQDLNATVRHNPQDAYAFYIRSQLLLYTGLQAQALRGLNRALEINPDLANALFFRSYIFFKQRDYGSAIDDLNKAIGLRSDIADYYLYRGWAFVRDNQYEKAIQDANTAIEMSAVKKLTRNVADLRRYYNAFDYHGETNVAVLAEQSRPQINSQSEMLLVYAYNKKLKNADAEEIKTVQKFLREEGHYEGPVSGVFSPNILTAMTQCIAARLCELKIDPVTGLQ